MKQYQKAQMIAKNLPTGSYAAGCNRELDWSDPGRPGYHNCVSCEVHN